MGSCKVLPKIVTEKLVPPATDILFRKKTVALFYFESIELVLHLLALEKSGHFALVKCPIRFHFTLKILFAPCWS